MKTRLDETNKMRRLMGLSLLTEQIKSVEPADPDFEKHLSDDGNPKTKEKISKWYKEREDKKRFSQEEEPKILKPGEDPHALPDTPKSPEKLITLDDIETLGDSEDSPLDIQLKLSKEQGKELEKELNAAVKEAERLKIEKNLSKIKLEAYLNQLKSNRVSGRILKRENKKVARLQRQIEKLENTTSETRKAASKKILKGILGVLVAGLSIVVVKDHPIVKGLLRKISSLKIPNLTTSPNSGGGVVPIGGNLDNPSGGGPGDIKTP